MGAPSVYDKGAHVLVDNCLHFVARTVELQGSACDGEGWCGTDIEWIDSGRAARICATGVRSHWHTFFFGSPFEEPPVSFLDGGAGIACNAAAMAQLEQLGAFDSILNEVLRVFGSFPYTLAFPELDVAFSLCLANS